MTDQETSPNLGIASRIRRSRGRGGRVFPAMSKVTKEERDELEAAAKREGKALGEWGREVLLKAARGTRTDPAVFTELVALRMLVMMALRPIALGEKLNPEAYEQILAEVRNGKQDAAREMILQYQTAQERGK